MLTARYLNLLFALNYLGSQSDCNCMLKRANKLMRIFSKNRRRARKIGVLYMRACCARAGEWKQGFLSSKYRGITANTSVGRMSAGQYHSLGLSKIIYLVQKRSSLPERRETRQRDAPYIFYYSTDNSR